MSINTTPLLRQYFSIREQHPEALLLLQVGDFYELLFDDAKKASAFLGITLTKRGIYNNQPIPLCGVPVHTLDHYLIKLVRGGFRIVVCNQLEVARPGKIVERGVTQVLTPGTLTDITLLDEKSASYCSVIVPTHQGYGLVFFELLTGTIFTTIIHKDDQPLLESELRRFSPDEIILSAHKQESALQNLLQKQGYVITFFDAPIDEELFNAWYASCTTTSHEIIACSETTARALKILYSYLKKNQEQALSQKTQILLYSPDDFLMLDAATQRNLELIKNLQDSSSSNTLFSILDRTATSMGSRMIKKWILRPLIKKILIEQRLESVELLVKKIALQEELYGSLKNIGDLERIVGRINLNRAHVHDYIGLMKALKTVPALQELCASYDQTIWIIKKISSLNSLVGLSKLLESALNDNLLDNGIIKFGYNTELDRMRSLLNDGNQAILQLERAEQEKTGIQSLKIRHNSITGYAIEITKANLELVPEEYQRLQTLVNRERFIIPALKDLEYDIAQAKNKSHELERNLYEAIKAEVLKHSVPLKSIAYTLAQCDAILGFAQAAYTHNFTRPTFSSNRDIIIVNGRHPVVASHDPHNFIANNTSLTDQERTWIITGPNMGGKSTYLRQVALISIMAQSGSFVPADSTQLPLLDRIFTRIGASDNVAAGKSTFLIEMEETALICNRATEKSLVILDEVGRGTSTYDGLAIAQAVLEYLHHHIQPRVLFATHYHELTALAHHHCTIAPYYAASMKTDSGSIVLLHKIVKGTAQGSFGIDVAKAAQLPHAIIQRAENLLQEFTLSN